MKRLNNLFDKICNLQNIEEADRKARRNKGARYGIKKHDLHRLEDNKKLLESLQNGTYRTSQYSTFKIYEPKERLIYRLPYYPDRIVHHAIMNVMEPIWKSVFIDQTYSSIKDRGIHACAKAVRKTLDKHPEETTYCLKLDIHKFYPSIDHEILKKIVRYKIKDKKLLNLLDGIIDSAPGVPIGNYLSQFLANLYLTYFDHWLKEELKVKFYFRYADDIVILHNDKVHLHYLLNKIQEYLKTLKLELKPNYQIFPVNARGIDFVGYKFYHTHTLLRKSIKSKINGLLDKYNRGKVSMQNLKTCMKSYFGWLKYCNSKHFLQKIQKQTNLAYTNFVGKEFKITKFKEKAVIRVIGIDERNKYFLLHFYYRDKPYYIKSQSKHLLNKIKENAKSKENSFYLVSQCNSETR